MKTKTKNKSKLKYILTVLLSFTAGQYCPVVVPLVEPAVEAIIPEPEEKPVQPSAAQPPADGSEVDENGKQQANSKQG